MAEVIEPFQEQDFRVLDESWMRVVHRNNDAPLMAYLERPKGHSKTTDTATMVAWALFASPRQLVGVAAAADKDQAGLLRNAVEKLCELNPWLRRAIKVKQWHITNPSTGSDLEIVSADEASSHGALPDFVIVDELTHHKKPGLWESLAAGAAKRAHCLLVVMANAGLGKGRSWQWKAREFFRQSPDCYFSRVDGPVALWITTNRLDQQRQLLPPKSFNRLWLNQWQTEAGDALDPADIEACCILDGPQSGPEDGWLYAGSLDLGVRHDHSALAILGANPQERKIRAAHVQSWKPGGPDNKVDLKAVELAVLRAHQAYGLSCLYYDAWQAEGMIQEFARQGIYCHRIALESPKVQTDIAVSLLGVFRQRAIELYHDADLLRDLSKLSITERPFGFKLEAIRDEEGHADRGIALAMALPDMLRGLREFSCGVYDEPQHERLTA